LSIGKNNMTTVPFVLTVKYVMRGQIPIAPFQVVTWSVYDVPDLTGAQSGYGANYLINIYPDYSQVLDNNGPIEPTTPVGPAQGDLSGQYPNPTVAKIQGITISSIAPINGQVLEFNGTEWLPVSSTITESLEGDVIGPFDDNIVSSLTGVDGYININGGFLTFANSLSSIKFYQNSFLSKSSGNGTDGATININSQFGQDVTGPFSAGAGGSIEVYSGNGGFASVSGSTGGTGGYTQIIGGDGGNTVSGGINGDGGNVAITSGRPGVGGTGGSAGVVYLGLGQIASLKLSGVPGLLNTFAPFNDEAVVLGSTTARFTSVYAGTSYIVYNTATDNATLTNNSLIFGNGVSNPQLIQSSLPSSSGTVSGNQFSILSQTGAVSTGSIGGIGGPIVIGAGNGGASTATSNKGGIGGSLNFDGGAGGASTGTSVNSNGGSINLTPGLPGTGGSGAIGIAGNVNINLTAAASGTTEPAFIINDTGTSIFTVQRFNGTSGVSGLYMEPGVSPSASNATISVNTSVATFNHPSIVNLAIDGATCIQINSNTVIPNIPTMSWSSTITNPVINQASTSAGSGNNFTIAAQGATGASHNGGNLLLSSGISGSGIHGSIQLLIDNNPYISCNPSIAAVEFFENIQFAASLNSPSITQISAPLTTVGQELIIQAQGTNDSNAAGNLIIAGGYSTSGINGNVQIESGLELAFLNGAISTANNITLNNSQLINSIFQLNGTIKTGGCIITLPNIVGLVTYFDTTGVTFGVNNLIFTTGSGTTATITSSAVGSTTGKYLLTVMVVGSNFVSVG
jgi:hypothetical protein